MSKLLNFAARVEDVARALVNRWWRPVAGLGIVASVYVNGVYLPLVTLRPPNLAELGAMITAVAGAFLVREWGKAQGTAQ